LQPAIREHLRSRDVRLEGVDGHWLQAQGIFPGPLLGRILAQTRDAVVDGVIHGEEQERAFALRLARRLAGSNQGPPS
ncbi:MAG: hypothetical protein KGR26_07965, partial [Cyanobacteria bacterium REEB65]|nr:hypothetical protein [Cyanobacteria bacterium REEB65]